MVPVRAPMLKTIPLAPIHPFTKQFVPSMHQKSFTRRLLRSFSPVLCVRLIKGFLLSITLNFLHARRFFFFFVCFFHFHRTPFRGLAGACVNPGCFSLVHSLICQITHSFLNGFQPNLCQHFSNVCSTCHSILIHPEVNTITLQADSSHNLDPRQMICISFEIHNL